MTHVSLDSYKEILLFLATAGLVVPLFRRLHISPILGFLGAGIVLGPYGLGALAHEFHWLSYFSLGNVDQIAPVAEFGVVFLLFMIGLELSWERLARLRKMVFGFGALQVFGCALALGGLAFAAHETASSAAVLGLALALSSTALVVPTLAEHKRLGTMAGRTIFSVLLFQDLMVAPLLFMVTMLGVGGGSLGNALLYTLLPALAGLTLVVLGGRLVLRPFFHHVAAAGSTEFFMAACLLVVIGTGLLTAMSGLSMGLGAFIAGILLAETEYRREIEVTIEPFKGLLLGLFFVSIGAGLDLSQIGAAPALTIGLALVVIMMKFVVIWISGRIMRLPGRIATETALMLAPGGEFAFVVIGAAIAGKAMPAVLGADAMIAVTLTMVAVPFLGGLARRLPRPVPAADAELAEVPILPEDVPAHSAIIVGYGRVGRLIGEMLSTHAIPYIAVDDNVALVKKYRREGLKIYWGNAARADFLARCGLAKAKALIITMDAPATAEEIVRLVRADHSDLTIVARARDAHHATILYKLGVTDAVPETIEASLQLSEAVLVDLGIPMGYVIASIHEKRDEFRKLLQPVAGRAEERRAVKMSLRLKEMSRHKPKLAED